MLNPTRKRIARFYFGIEFDKDGAPLLFSQVRALQGFKKLVAREAGGLTVYEANGVSVECPLGERTVVIETILPDDRDAVARIEEALLVVKAAMNQGSVLVTISEQEVLFV